MTVSTRFSYSGSNVYVHKLNEETVTKELKPKIYEVQFNQLTGFYLSIVKDRFEVPKKIYGKTLQRADKCINTYQLRSSSTGILMTGDKGTGKTLLMSILSNKIIDELKIPVVIIAEPHSGTAFTDFIQNIGECCIVLDEFGKMYGTGSSNIRSAPQVDSDGSPSQDDLLTLMDGLDKTKRMFIMTENSILDINDFLLNRPSRIYYHFKYSKLDEESISGYCNDRGVSEEVVNDIIDLSRRLLIFSFDMMQSIVEEHLRYNESVSFVIEELNVNSDESEKMIEISKVVDKEDGKERKIMFSNIVTERHNSYRFDIVGTPGEFSDDKDHNYTDLYLSENDIAYEANGNLIFEVGDYQVIAKRLERKAADYWKMV